MFSLFLTSTSTSAENDSGTNGGGTEFLKKILTNPIFYIIIGGIVLFLIIVYLIKRFIKAKPNATTIILRRGHIHKVLDKAGSKYFLVPFVDSIGAVILDTEKVFSSDKLFINNGPDTLYRINYTFKYKVTNPKEFYKYIDKINDLLPTKLNDELRLFADRGNALILIKDYRNNTDKILKVMNNALAEYFIEVTEFKINLIEPLGK